MTPAPPSTSPPPVPLDVAHARRLARPHAAARALLALAASCLAACASVPTPLAPAVGGSVGSPSFGVLLAPQPLADAGPGFRRLRPWAPARHGTPALLRVVETAARRVVEREGDGPPLVVGDVSGPHGGHISGHHSHRTGRDVDLLFFYTTPAGVPVEAPGFVPVGTDGLAHVDPALAPRGAPDHVRLDVPRSWALVKALLEQREAEISWLFVVTHVEALLVEYALARGEPLDLIWRAESVLHQPADSAPHDDHFHLRIACSPAEEVAGCLSGGPRWPWGAAQPTLPPMTDAELAALVDDAPTAVKGIHATTEADVGGSNR